MRVLDKIRNFLMFPRQIREIHDLILLQQTKALQANHPNPLARFGRKCFSQNDEDGITLEILRRLGKLENGVYAEFGVGDGTENNTLILAAMGWKGFWSGGEDLSPPQDPMRSDQFTYVKDWITAENIVDITRRGLKGISAEQIDVLSLDLDGNDIYMVENLLRAGFTPKLFIVEYNAKFPPPVEFQIKYDPTHTWMRDDYYGASLTSFAKLFGQFSYKLVCCNAQSGSNAFFVPESEAAHFGDVPTDINDIYSEPQFFFYNRYAHPLSIRTVKTFLRN